MPENMLACLLKGPGEAIVDNVPIPKISAREVLVKLSAAGICGTDVEKLEGGLGPGGILGHEVSGRVDKVGAKVPGISVGERVVAHHHVPCLECHYCSRADYTMCDFFKRTNFDPCGLAEYFRVPQENVRRGAIITVPDDVEDEEAALVEPSACCLRAVKTVGVAKGDIALVVGLGPTGLTHLQLLRHYGASRVIGTDVSSARLQMGNELGADMTIDSSERDFAESIMSETKGIGVDLAIVAAGNPRAFAQALTTVRKGGRVCLFGAPRIGSMHELDLHDLFAKQIRIVPSYSCVESEMQEVLALLAEGKLDLKRLVTSKYPLREAVNALENARSPSLGVKTIIVP